MSPQQDPVKPNQSPIMRWLLIGLGCLFLALGIVGVVLPVLPTTPFVLVAAACFARSSPRLYQWLLNHGHIGPYIKAWRYERRIPRRAKILAVTMIVLSIGASILFVIPLLPVKILLGVIAISVILYICHFPD